MKKATNAKKRRNLMSSKKSVNMNILGIVGSPRSGGNTDILVDEVLKGAKEEGAKTRKFMLNDLRIAPCKACNGCVKTEKCVHEDDMIEIVKEMEKSQTWVLGTPIYWWGPTAQFKTFLDRWYGIKTGKFRGKRVILVIPMGGGSPNYAQYTVGMLTSVINYLGMELLTSILAPGVSRKGDVRSDVEVLEKARAAGTKAASV